MTVCLDERLKKENKRKKEKVVNIIIKTIEEKWALLYLSFQSTIFLSKFLICCL
jgi:hypothetical protein